MKKVRFPVPQVARNGHRAAASDEKRNLRDRVLENDHLADLGPAERRLALRALVADVEGEAASPDVAVELADSIDGFGPLAIHMRQPGVTDILVNGPNEIWIDRDGFLERSEVRFAGEAALLEFVQGMLSRSGARVDAARPIADARLADGSRIHVVLPPLADQSTVVSIRRFPETPLTLDDLVVHQTVDAAQADVLRDAVRSRTSIVVSGGTGSGKTTLLNALLGHVGESERVVIIEEIPELRPACSHVVRLVARPANVEGRGAVELEQLVRASLRMRPDRIIVGEARGPEALAALTAMSVGHEGSMLTVHARSAAAALDRIVSLAMLASTGASEAALQRQVAAAIGVVVHLRRDGPKRRVAEILRTG